MAPPSSPPKALEAALPVQAREYVGEQEPVEVMSEEGAPSSQASGSIKRRTRIHPEALSSFPSTPRMFARQTASGYASGDRSPQFPFNNSSLLFQNYSSYSSDISEAKRPAFRSARLKDGEDRLSENVWTKTKEGKKANRKNYYFFLTGVMLGLLGAIGLIVQGFLSVPKHNYCLVLEDNFNGPLDTSIWKHEMETGGFGNNEFEWTTDSANNSFTADGNLYLVPTLTSDSLGEAAVTNGYHLNLTEAGTCTASNKTDASCAVASNSTTGVILPPIQSARLTTRGTKGIRYGRVEVKARLPKGDWLWPAIWMMPTDSVYGAWPASGEIDIVESKGNMPKARSDQLSNVVRSSLHWGPDADQDRWWSTTGIAQVWRNYFNQDYYVFGLEWDENSIYTWSGSRTRKYFEKKFDRDMYASSGFASYSGNGTVIHNPWANSKNPKTAPFDQEFYLILNVAVGGTNGYFSDSDEATPYKPWSNSGINPRSDFWNARSSWLPTWPTDPKKRGMAIDYVKMWQKC